MQLMPLRTMVGAAVVSVVILLIMPQYMGADRLVARDVACRASDRVGLRELRVDVVLVPAAADEIEVLLQALLDRLLLLRGRCCSTVFGILCAISTPSMLTFLAKA